MLVIVLKGKASFIVKIFSSLKCKAIDGIASFFWFLILAKICFVLMFFQMTLIFLYESDVLSRPSLVRSSLSQVVFFTANIEGTYSTFVNDRATIAYFLAHQLTKPLFSIKTKSKIDFLMAWLPVQSDSEYSFIVRSPSPFFYLPQVIFIDLIAFKYLIIVLTTFVYWQKKFLANILITKVANAISSLVSVIENMRDPIIP